MFLAWSNMTIILKFTEDDSATALSSCLFCFLCLQEVLDIARLLLVELGQHNDCEIEEKKSKLEQLKTVLEMWGTTPASSIFLFVPPHLHHSSAVAALALTCSLDSFALSFPPPSVSSLLPTYPLPPFSTQGSPAWMTLSTHSLTLKDEVLPPPFSLVCSDCVYTTLGAAFLSHTGQ